MAAYVEIYDTFVNVSGYILKPQILFMAEYVMPGKIYKKEVLEANKSLIICVNMDLKVCVAQQSNATDDTNYSSKCPYFCENTGSCLKIFF